MHVSFFSGHNHPVVCLIILLDLIFIFFFIVSGKFLNAQTTKLLQKNKGKKKIVKYSHQPLWMFELQQITIKFSMLNNIEDKYIYFESF